MSTRPEVAVGAVVVDDERLLLVLRGRPPGEGTWSIPGGHLERGETLAEAVVRELREETGLDGVCGPFIGWSELVPDDGGDGAHVVLLDFEVTLFMAGEPVAGDDVLRAEWVSLGDVAERRLAPGLAEFLHDHDIIATFT